MTESDNADNRWTYLLMLIGGAALLSTSAPWVRVADVAPTAAGFYRMAIGAVSLLGVCLATGREVWSGPRYALRFLPVGAFFAADLFMWHRCIHYVGPGLATILANLQVFFLAAAGALFYGEKIGWKFATGLALVLPGVWVLVGVDLGNLESNYLYGVALGMGAAVAYSGYLLTLRRAQQADDHLTATADLMYATFWCGLLSGGLVLVESSSFAVADTPSWLALLAYGLLCQVAGWMLITSSMPRLPASLVGLLLLLQPALAMVWDVLFFARPARLTDALAAAVVLAGLYLGSLDRR